MQRLLGEHIQTLEKKRLIVNDQILRETSKAKRHQLESELQVIEMALLYYRRAFEFRIAACRRVKAEPAHSTGQFIHIA